MRASLATLSIVALLKLLMLIDEVELVVPVAVAFDISEQSERKLLNDVILMPCSALGVSAMMQPSVVLVVVVVVTGCVVVLVVVVLTCAATARARILAVGLVLLSKFKNTAPRLKPMLFL